ncbi:MAG: hypothetical protein ACO22M_07365 [Candidatus Nanopelagicaceae bacterium]
MKELIQQWINRPPLTEQEIEVRTWSFVVRSITCMVMIIAFGVLWLIGFEEQTGDLAPIDAVFLEILKAIAFMGVGAMGAISGRKGSSAPVKPEGE